MSDSTPYPFFSSEIMVWKRLPVTKTYFEANNVEVKHNYGKSEFI